MAKYKYETLVSSFTQVLFSFVLFLLFCLIEFSVISLFFLKKKPFNWNKLNKTESALDNVKIENKSEWHFKTNGSLLIL